MNNEQIATAFVACKNWKWMDGMRVRSYALAGVGGPYETLRLESPTDGPRYNVFPDVEDAATVGCILALLRSLSGWSDLHATAARDRRGDVRWYVRRAESIPEEILDMWEPSEIEAMLKMLQVLDNPLTESP